MNGSLWSIPFEVFCYIFLICMFTLGCFKSRIFATLIIAFIIIDGLFGNKFLFTWIDINNKDTFLLATSFAFGALLALWQDKITVNLYFLLAFWVLFYILNGTYYSVFLLFFAIFVSIIYVASLPFVLLLKPSSDISYGVYLWGWPVQQTLVTIFPNQSAITNAISAIIVAFLVGLLSWHLIEKPSIQYGKKLAAYFNNLNRKKSTADQSN